LSEIPLKPGQRVRLKAVPRHTGTVTRADSRQFGVTFDGYDRRRGESRSRFTYPVSEAVHFELVAAAERP
jgi:hypothetical protein